MQSTDSLTFFEGIIVVIKYYTYNSVLRSKVAPFWMDT